MNLEVSDSAPADWDALLAYVREKDKVGAILEDDAPDAEMMSRLAFRRFRHDFTNYDEMLDSGAVSRGFFVAVTIQARALYPQISFLVLEQWLTRKVRELTPSEEV